MLQNYKQAIDEELTDHYSRRSSRLGGDLNMMSMISSEGHKNKSMLDKEFE